MAVSFVPPPKLFFLQTHSFFCAGCTAGQVVGMMLRQPNAALCKIIPYFQRYLM
jgi:hypothetical protein